jgi:uncharacterized membrane protein YphA (DoxX/SURF4 family)
MEHLSVKAGPLPRDLYALALRIGLGSVFVIGGLAKLSRLLSPTQSEAIVAEYMGPLGYINQTFQQWLFESWLGVVLTPWNFLTLLSGFELISGMMLIAGLLVRPLALIWAPLLWTFVFSLPVVTTPGETLTAPTYTSPAMFVQIRDIALCGLFVALYNLGSGRASIDASFRGHPTELQRDWEGLGALMRWSLALAFIIGGLFHGYPKIASFATLGLILAVIGLGLASGYGTRVFAAAACAVLLWYMTTKLGGAASLLGYFNSVKRELGLLAGSAVVAHAGGGRMFTINHLLVQRQAAKSA